MCRWVALNVMWRRMLWGGSSGIWKCLAGSWLVGRVAVGWSMLAGPAQSINHRV